MVIRGFTATGDVIVNDPTSRLIPSDAAVENVFDRQQFADVWLPSSRSGGIAYVIHPAGTPLPANIPGPARELVSPRRRRRCVTRGASGSSSRRSCVRSGKRVG